MERHKTVQAYLAAAKQWKPELKKLRAILKATDLEETVKWGAPTYTYDGKNLVGIGGFKHHFGLWFFQGALLADKKKLLINAQEGTTKALRQMRFEAASEINQKAIEAYVKEAIGLVKKGVEIKPQRKKAVAMPDELAAAFRKQRKAESSFNKLTPGKQREYAEYVATAKQDATKLRRVAKILPMIEAGVGLHDKYRNC